MTREDGCVFPCRRANGRGTGRMQSGVQPRCQSAVWPSFNGLSSEGSSDPTVLTAACDLTPLAARIE